MLNLSKKIVVAIDGSPASDKAAEEAVRLASVSGARFMSTVYAVLVLPASQASAVIDYLPEQSSGQSLSLSETRRRIFSVVQKVADEAGVMLELVTRYGDPVDEILAVADEYDCDVVTIGSSGKGRLQRALHGSVSAKISTQARCSVYIVR